MLPFKKLFLLPALLVCVSACSDKPQDTAPEAGAKAETVAAEDSSGHSHVEVPIGLTKIGDLLVSLAQGHGAMKAGEESHLVIAWPVMDGGATTVRAWIGTSDRSQSLVEKGTFSPSRGDYNVHVMAPDPLPDGVQWWVEIERPNGSRSVGSADPILE
ncbi:MAG: hypothetical protein P1V35_03575 [Planctomycetota bacterium]|nr:hypothetical protein [Planctomycetota bacterium]